MLEKYQWILFDADETLFHFDAFQGLVRMFSGYGVAFSQEDYQQYQTLNKPLWVEYQHGRLSAQALQETRFRQWGERLDVSPAELNLAFLQAMADTCALLPGAESLLQALKGRVSMGIITNGFTALQRLRLERTGCQSLFDLLVISEEVGVAKPALAIFDHAFARMGNPPKETILMVGDTLHSDILGGLNAGIDTCWMNPHGHTPEDGITPHFQVASLAELEQRLIP